MLILLLIILSHEHMKKTNSSWKMFPISLGFGTLEYYTHIAKNFFSYFQQGLFYWWEVFKCFSASHLLINLLNLEKREVDFNIKSCDVELLA